MILKSGFVAVGVIEVHFWEFDEEGQHWENQGLIPINAAGEEAEPSDYVDEDLSSLPVIFIEY